MTWFTIPVFSRILAIINSTRLHWQSDRPNLDGKLYGHPEYSSYKGECECPGSDSRGRRFHSSVQKRQMKLQSQASSVIYWPWQLRLCLFINISSYKHSGQVTSFSKEHACYDVSEEKRPSCQSL